MDLNRHQKEKERNGDRDDMTMTMIIMIIMIIMITVVRNLKDESESDFPEHTYGRILFICGM